MIQVNTKLRLKAEDSDSEEIVEVAFGENELSLLKQFRENISRIETARLIESGMPVIESISWTEGEGINFTISDFEYRDVYELLHLARPFLLSREPASFEKVWAAFRSKCRGTALELHLKFIRSLYVRGEYQPYYQITIANTPLFHEDTLKDWLNGEEYHQDADMRERIKELEGVLSKDTAKGIFVAQLSGKIKAIFMLSHLVSFILRSDSTG